MSKERTIITQKLCDHVKALLAGKLTHKQAAEFTGIGKATVDRIVAAGFNAEQYAKNTAARKEEKKAALVGNYFTKDVTKFMPPTGEQLAEELAPGAGQIKGQIEMDLTEKKPKNYQEALTMYCQEAGLDERDKKLMRFEAALTDKIRGEIQNIGFENIKAIYELKGEVGKIRDMLSQILRRKDK